MELLKYINRDVKVYKTTTNGNGEEVKILLKTIKARITSETIRYIDKDGNTKNAQGTIRSLEELDKDMELIDEETGISYRLQSIGPIYNLDGTTISHYRGILI